MQITFGTYRLNSAARELTRDGQPVTIEPKAFDLLCHLVAHRDRAVSRDELVEMVWKGRFISDAAVSSAVSSARRAIGDDGTRQALLKTVHGHGFRFVGEVEEMGPGAPPPATATPADIHQDIRYCTARDGTRLAYASIGDGPALLRTGNWMTHLEYELESPLWRHWVEGLSNGRRFLRYDQRGNGLSARKVDDVSFDAMVSDLEVVVEAAGLDRFTLMGMSQGCAVSVEYAARHPEKLNGLILYGGFARGWERTNYPNKDHYRAMSTLIRTGWGQDNPAFRQLFTSGFLPGGSVELQDWFNELQRKTVSPDVAARLYDAFGDFDVVPRLEGISLPTLVLHTRDDRIIPLEASQAIASRIPDARLATFASSNHIMMADEPAFPLLLDEIDRFLAAL